MLLPNVYSLKCKRIIKIKPPEYVFCQINNGAAASSISLNLKTNMTDTERADKKTMLSLRMSCFTYCRLSRSRAVSQNISEFSPELIEGKRAGD